MARRRLNQATRLTSDGLYSLVHDGGEKDLWRAFGKSIMAEWQRFYPGQRPAAYWKFDIKLPTPGNDPGSVAAHEALVRLGIVGGDTDAAYPPWLLASDSPEHRAAVVKWLDFRTAVLGGDPASN